MAIKVYSASAAGGLRQGEIIEGLTQPRIDVERLRAGEVEVRPVVHRLVIVLSQDCDLEQDYTRRLNGEADDLLQSVVFCVVEDAATFRGTLTLNSKEWKRVERNNEPRYHFLREVPAADDSAQQGLGTLAVDFKACFALPTEEAYYWLESATRRCRLESPYTEHLASRFAGYFSRVALPLDHHLPLPAPPADEQPDVGADAPQVQVAALAPPATAPAAGAYAPAQPATPALEDALAVAPLAAPQAAAQAADPEAPAANIAAAPDDVAGV